MKRTLNSAIQSLTLVLMGFVADTELPIETG